MTVKMMLIRMMPTKARAILPSMAVSPAGTATSSTHWVILGMNSTATLARALRMKAVSILPRCRLI